MKYLDDKWFQPYKQLTDTVGETYEKLEPSPHILAKMRQKFIDAGDDTTITLLSDKPNIQALEAAREAITALLARIQSEEQNTLVRQCYQEALVVLDNQARLIIAGATNDMQTYRNANELLYSLPSSTIFRAACSWIHDDALKTPVDHSELLARLCNDVLKAIPAFSDDYSLLIPSESVFTKVRAAHQPYYASLFGRDGLPEEPYIDEQAGIAICQKVLKAIGSDFTLEASDNNIWAVLPSKKQVVHPQGFRLDRDEFVGIVCHEIGSHVLESVNGARSPLRLLGTGLAGYEKGNEGRAFLREQIVYSSERTFLQQFSWEYIVLLHVSTSLAAGLHHYRYTFSELYDILYKLYFFWRERRMPRATNNQAFASDEAWYLAVRILKGTPADGSASYLKDSVYLEGNVACWQLAAKDPSIVLFGDRGKFDISNPVHIDIAHQLRVL